MKIVSLHLYQYHELSDTAQQKAVADHREFLLSTMQFDDFISGCPEYDTPEQLQFAYNSEYEYYLFNDEPIIESIEINEYWFFHDGTIAHVTVEPSGRHVFHHHGESDTFYLQEEN